MEPYKQLEQQFAKFVGVDPAGMVVCSSGTAALHLALECGWGHGRGIVGTFNENQRRVLIPDFAMIAIPRAVTLAGGTPVVADIGALGTRDEYGLDVDGLIAPDVLSRINPASIVSVIAVDTYGRSANIQRLYDIRKGGVIPEFQIVQDAAENHGASIHRDSTGIPLADAICWSFYRNKIIGGEEGGAVWFKNRASADAARMRRSMGFTDAHDYTHIPRGHNYRLANALAVPILASLNNYHENYRRRRRLESILEDCCPRPWRSVTHRNAPWVYDVQLPDTGGYRLLNHIVLEMQKRGVPIRHGFKPVSSQPEYASILKTKPNDTPIAYERARTTFYLSLDERDWAGSQIQPTDVFSEIVKAKNSLIMLMGGSAD